MNRGPVWVAGSRGLLGTAVVRALRQQHREPLVPRIPWGTADAPTALRDVAATLTSQAAGGPWDLIWCAGAGVTGASKGALQQEVAAFREALYGLAAVGAQGRVLLASSAGGLYAGSLGAPHTEDTQPVPLSEYGFAKLAAEAELAEWAARTGGRAVAVRYANLYGPGQDLRKPQGLISHLCRGFLTGQPVSIYVPGDTLRDYMFVDDAASVTLALTDVSLPAGELVVKVCASGESVTITGLVGVCRAVFRRRPRVVMGSSPLSAAQALDLRLRSVVLPDIWPRPHTTLVAGIGETLAGTRVRLFGT